MAEQKTVFAEQKSENIWQHEDAVMKTMMNFFADELLPYFKIEGKVAAVAPTELVHMELKKLNQDFNLVMEDGSWKHFEFQSRNEGKKDLKRFRVYEALTSYQHDVSVTTYVLYSGKIKKPVTEFTEGANTYRVCPIVLSDKNSDQLILQLQEKAERGEVLTKEDLIPLALCPLMSGDMSQKQRIRFAFKIMGNARIEDPQIVQKIEAVIYTMADKFLDRMEMDEIREEIKMTVLGQMLVNDGIAQGIAQGITQTRMELVKKKLQKGKSVEEIADALEETVETVQELIAKLQNSSEK